MLSGLNVMFALLSDCCFSLMGLVSMACVVGCRALPKPVKVLLKFANNPNIFGSACFGGL